MNQRTPEVLAPAGDLTRLKAAVNYGADAVYIGGELFGMRTSPSNFTIDSMKEGIAYAHARDCKVYLTLNTVPKNDEIKMLTTYLQTLKDVPLDACIVADLGVFTLVKTHLPEMELHISTQAGIVNYETANLFYQMGAKRVVLARELSFPEIREIRDNTPPELDIEAFVHGSMCMAFSGRCLLSNYMVGRDANRGECAQPCRWKYALVDKRKPQDEMDILEDENGTYIMNAKDLCMVDHIAELVEAGITSLKIEGRAKSEYYVSVVTNAYRIAVDAYLKDPSTYQTPQWLLSEIRKVSHRTYSTGFYFGRPEDGQYYENSGYIRSYDVVAVSDRLENGRLYCTQRNKFFEGDTLEVLIPGQEPFTFVANNLCDAEGNHITETPHPMMEFSLAFETELPNGTMIRKEI